MTDLVRALLDSDPDEGAVLECVRWIAPWVQARPTDESLVLEALVLADRLPREARVLWLWWIGGRRPDLVDGDDLGLGSGLSVELTDVLRWTLGRGAGGATTYATLLAYAEPYDQALREVERAARDYPSLVACVDALSSTDADLSLVMARLPGGHSSAALRDGRKALVLRAARLRDTARAAGVESTFPVLRSRPRFARISDATRELCLDILDELNGPTVLGSAERVTLTVSTALPVPQRMSAWRSLDTRGLPVADLGFGQAEWLQLLGARREALPSGAPALLTVFSDVLERRATPTDWVVSVTRAVAWEDAVALTRGYEVLALQDGSLAADLLEIVDVLYPDLAEGWIRQALDTGAPAEVALFGLTRALAQLDLDLTLAESSLTW